jgi:hypothetical protein
MPVTICVGGVIKLTSSLMLLFVLVVSVSASAQEPTSVAEQVDKLKAQLLEVQGKEDALRTRLQQLELPIACQPCALYARE